jgi:hypothetical protein
VTKTRTSTERDARASSDALACGLNNRGDTPGRLTPTAGQVAGAALLAIGLAGCASLTLMDQLDRQDRERKEREDNDSKCRALCPEHPDAPKCRANCPGLYEAVLRARAGCGK